MRRTRRVIAAAVAAGVALALVPVGAALGSSATLDGLTAAGTVTASPATFWYAQANRDGICGLIAGCIGARGTDPSWVFQVQYEGPTGIQATDVDVTVVSEQMPAAARYRLAFDSAVGDLAGDVVLGVAPRGSGAAVSVTLEAMTASGFATGVLDQFREQLQPYLTAQLQALDAERAAAGATVAVRVRPGAKASATVAVSATALSRQAPRATGTLRLLSGSTVLCTAPLRASRATCAFTPPRPRAPIEAIVTGDLSNGYALWTSTRMRYGR